MPHEKDFFVSNQFSESDLEILLNFQKIKNSKKIKDIISRKPEMENENQFLLDVAKNLTFNKNKLFRKRDDANSELINLWLSLIEKKSLNTYLKGNTKVFTDLDFENLGIIASLSRDVQSIHYISRILKEEYGIILIIEKSFKGMKLEGCTFCLPNKTPVIGLSLRYSRYDYFWFTLMHELSHIALHYDKLDTPILDDLDIDTETDVEIEANRAAADSLIPREANRAVFRTFNEPDSLISVCERFNIHPIIAAGAVRNKHKNYVIFSSLVNSIDVRRELGFNE